MAVVRFVTPSRKRPNKLDTFLKMNVHETKSFLGTAEDFSYGLLHGQ